MSYPKQGSLSRIIYKLPLLFWRLGFGPILSHPGRGGSKMMVVTTRGRKTGKPRHTMVSCIDFDKRQYAISGWWTKSDWVKNFQHDPLVTIQVEMKIYAAHARRVEDLDEIKGVIRTLIDSGGDSHFEDWLDDLQIQPSFEDLLANRDRIYFIGFDPVKELGPDPLPADLIWIWGVIFSILLGLIFFFW